MDVANPAATVVLPGNGSTVAGSQWLDCVPPAGYDDVQFWFESLSLSGPEFLGDATPTYVGWLYEWGTPSVEDGIYGIYCTAEGPSGANAFSPIITVDRAELTEYVLHRDFDPLHRFCSGDPGS